MDRLLLYFTVKNQCKRINPLALCASNCSHFLDSYEDHLIEQKSARKEYRTRGWCRTEMQAAASNEKNKNVEILL